ncbi:MAG: NAD-binding protein, partial [Saprospiraceae bacterium]|nr:NAD-binding protein [Saprospiraceae bacterium]
SALLLFFTLIIGILGFVLIDDYTLSEAFYMTIITLSTVGYGEVKALSSTGQFFAALLIIFNIGIFAYAVSLISSFFVDGELRAFWKDYKIYKKIRGLENHTIICGYGRHGQEIVRELKKAGQDFVVIETDTDRVEQMRRDSCIFLEGDATQDELLIDAGIKSARAIVITFGEDASNVYAVLTARELNPRIRIISRASEVKVEQKLLRAGADYVVLSEIIGGFYMATLVNQPNVVEFFNILSNMGEVSILFKEIDFEHLKKEFRNKQIQNLNLRAETGVNIIGVRNKKGKYIVNPNPNVCIEKGMRLIILGDNQQIERFQQKVLITKG